MNINTKYGVLKNCQEVTYHENGALATVFTHAPTQLKTPVGKIIPAYNFSSERRKYIPSAKFFATGDLQAINLDKQMEIKTSMGNFLCEYISFYPCGSPHRLLHLNGKLSGYWSEAQETALAQISVLNLPCGLIKTKIMTLNLYDTGTLSSITLFPDTVIEVSTNMGYLKTRIGLSFYPSGALRSLEPAAPIEIETPLGKVRAFDTNPIGVTGDKNSLQWDEIGVICACKTTDNITISFADGSVKSLEAKTTLSMCSDDVMVKVPYTISWNKSMVCIEGIANNKIVYNRSEIT